MGGGKKQAPGPPTWAGAAWGCAIGTPSAGLSLVGLRPRRARLRLTRRREGTEHACEEQEQRPGAGPERLARPGGPLNPGGSLLLADVGPFCAPITTPWLRRSAAGKARSSRRRFATPAGPG